MQRLILIGAIAAVAFACGTGADMIGEMLDAGVPDAGAESPGDGTTMQYVGNSTKTFRGYRTLSDDNGTLRDEYDNTVRTGIFEYYAACQETFGAGHRTCEGAEIRFTTKIPQLEGLAWYGIGSDCGSIASNSGYGTRSAVRATGNFVSAKCSSTGYNDVTLPIACCGPR